MINKTVNILKISKIIYTRMLMLADLMDSFNISGKKKLVWTRVPYYVLPKHSENNLFLKKIVTTTTENPILYKIMEYKRF